MKKSIINDKNAITLFISGDFPEGNSKNARIKSIAKFYLNQNFDVRIISLYPSRYTLAKNNRTQGMWEGIEYRSFSNTTASTSQIGRILQITIAQLKAVYYIIKHRKTLINTYFYCPRFTDLILTMFFCRFFSLNIIVDQTELFSSRVKWPHTIEESLVRRWANHIWCISRKLTDYYKAYQPKANVQLLPILVDLKRFDTDISSSKYTIGYLGSFDPKDNVEVLIDGFALALKDYPDLTFNLYGYTPRLEHFNKYINDLGLNASVKLFGAVQYDKIPKHLMSCDTLVIARTSDVFASYGYPYKLGEYYASKVPVLSSAIKGFSEELSDGIELLKFKDNDPESFVQAVHRRYSNTKLAESIVSRAYQHAQDHFNIEHHSSLLLSSTI